MKSNRIHRGGQSFFRYSKLCFLQWLGSLALIIAGLVLKTYWWVPVGFAAIFVFPILNEAALNIWAAVFQRSEDPTKVKERFANMQEIMPIVYSPGYNITAGGLEGLHPFDSTKYRRIWEFLFEKGALDIQTQKFFQPDGLPNRKWLLEVMTPGYLMKLNYSVPVSSYIELPVCFLPAWVLRS